MFDRLFPGWVLNAVWLLHLLVSNKSRWWVKVLALAILTIPYLGFVFYFLLFVFEVPPPQPMHLRQNRWNHYGTTEFGEPEYGFSDGMGTSVSEKFRRRGKGALWVRGGIVLVGLHLMFLGIASIKFGLWSYSNWWGDAVFGPVPIILGGVALYVATIGWKKF